jgi:hypothetical protein
MYQCIKLNLILNSPFILFYETKFMTKFNHLFFISKILYFLKFWFEFIHNNNNKFKDYLFKIFTGNMFIHILLLNCFNIIKNFIKNLYLILSY